MAKRSGRKHKKASSAARHHSVSHPSYAGKKYDCYGTHVRTGHGNKKAPRVFCGKVQTAASK